MSSKVSPTSSGDPTSTNTPPASDLCRASGETTFMTTGYPASPAKDWASFTLVATLDQTEGTPKEAARSRASSPKSPDLFSIHVPASSMSIPGGGAGSPCGFARFS